MEPLITTASAFEMETHSTRRKPPLFMAMALLSLGADDLTSNYYDPPSRSASPDPAKEAEVDRIRQERIQRKLLNARRRLPKGHPYRI
jgi:hypothetical protein